MTDEGCTGNGRGKGQTCTCDDCTTPPVDGAVDLVGALRKAVDAARARRLGEHSSNPREDA